MFHIFQQHLLYLCVVPVSLEWQICLQMVRISLFMVVKIVGFKYQKLISRMFDLFYFFLSSMSCLLLQSRNVFFVPYFQMMLKKKVNQVQSNVYNS